MVERNKFIVVEARFFVMSGASYVTKQAPVALGDAANQPDVFSINIADYNSSSTLYNVNSLSELKTPGVFGKQPVKIMPVKAGQSECAGDQAQFESAAHNKRI